MNKLNRKRKNALFIGLLSSSCSSCSSCLGRLTFPCLLTLMRQRVLSEPAWQARLQPEDLRALTPLVYRCSAVNRMKP